MWLSKFLAISFTILQFIAGGFTLATGIWLLSDPRSVTHEFLPLALPICTIVLSAVFCLSLLLFIVYVMKDDAIRVRQMLGVLSVIAVVSLLFTLLTVTIDAASDRITTDRWIDGYKFDPDFIVRTENKFHCCGLKKVTDLPVPQIFEGDAKTCVNDPKLGYHRPCFSLIRNQIHMDLGRIGGIWLIFGLMSVLALIAGGYYAYCLPEDVEKQERIITEQQRLVGRILPGGYSARRGDSRA